MLDKKLVILEGVHPIVAVEAFKFFQYGKTVGNKENAGTFTGTGPDLVLQILHVYQTKTQYVIGLISQER